MGRAEDLFANLRAKGEAEIDRLIDDRQSENLWLDFKRSADHGAGKKLHENDWKNLAKAISGFGNSEGGVIIWGVDCSDDPLVGDVPAKKVPIVNPQRFVSWVEGAVSACTIPPHRGVESIVIAAAGGSEKGYVATLVPFSNLAPHQCVKPAGVFQYYIRAGSSFMPTPHGVLAGLFGRRPQPNVFQIYESSAKIGSRGGRQSIEVDGFIHIFNEGPAIARNVFASLILGIPGGGSEATMQPDPNETGYWFTQMEFGIWCTAMANDTFALAPQTSVRSMMVHLALVPPFLSDYGFRLFVGCDGAPVQTTDIRMTEDELASFYDRALLLFAKKSPNASQEVLDRLLGSTLKTTL
jgi:hypothetical protein